MTAVLLNRLNEISPKLGRNLGILYFSPYLNQNAVEYLEIK